MTTISSILEQITSADSKEAKLKLVNQFKSAGLKNLFIALLHPETKINVSSDLADVEPSRTRDANLDFTLIQLDAFFTGTNVARLDEAFNRLRKRLVKEDFDVLTGIKDRSIDVGLAFEDLGSVWPELEVKGEKKAKVRTVDVGDLGPEEAVKKVNEAKEAAKAEEPKEEAAKEETKAEEPEEAPKPVVKPAAKKKPRR